MKWALVLIAAALVAAASADARVQGGAPTAFVTAETQNELLAVDLPSGRILRRLPMPADPQNVEINGNLALVVSTRAGALTLVDTRRLRVRKVIRGFGSPHIVAIAWPTANWAYVTDDARGQLDVVDLRHGRILRRVYVGLGAHHLTLYPDAERMWIALGERARTIVVLDTTDPTRPRVLERFDPGFAAHDLAFSPNGSRVWVTSDSDPYVHVLSARTHATLFRVYGGSPPQHVVLSTVRRETMDVTSGVDGTLRFLDPRTGRLRKLIRTPYGSFNLGLGGSLVATSSLYRGTLTELDEAGRVILSTHVASAARDVAIGVRP